MTAFWFNPNIFPEEEAKRRLKELKRHCERINCPLVIADIPDSPRMWSSRTSPLMGEPEGGVRCTACIGYRLEETAKHAKAEGFDAFGTTLTTSPHKNAKIINSKGKMIGEEFLIEFVESDFKKNNGYLRSINVCKELNIYRQKYCGCRLSIKN